MILGLVAACAGTKAKSNKRTRRNMVSSVMGTWKIWKGGGNFLTGRMSLSGCARRDQKIVDHPGACFLLTQCALAPRTTGASEGNGRRQRRSQGGVSGFLRAMEGRGPGCAGVEGSEGGVWEAAVVWHTWAIPGLVRSVCDRMLFGRGGNESPILVAHDTILDTGHEPRFVALR